jgi:hypothetical protein
MVTIALIPLSEGGRRGLSILNFFNTPHRFPLPKFFAKTLMINNLIAHFKPTPQPEADPKPIPALEPEPAPEPVLPASTHKPQPFAIGEEVTAAVSVKTCPHPKMLYILPPGFDGPAVTYVQTKEDWRTNDRIKVRFARVRPDGVLEFDGPKGAHRNKFGRRP